LADVCYCRFRLFVCALSHLSTIKPFARHVYSLAVFTGKIGETEVPQNVAGD